MSPAVFSVRGVVVDEAGAPAGGVVVALVDEDAVSDDLIGVGLTGDDGAFGVSFTKEAFQQEALEVEVTPDLYLVASVKDGERLVPVARVDLGTLDGPGERDVGAVRLPLSAGRAPVAVPELEPVPGGKKRARRTRLSDELVRVAADEIRPIVERLTGLPVGGTQVHVLDRVGRAHAAIVARVTGKPMSEAQIVGCERGAGFMGLAGLYDPFSGAVFLDRVKLERQNLDGVKVMIGHELVHAGQFKAHPAMIDAFTETLRDTVRAAEVDATAAAEAVAAAGKAAVDLRDAVDPALGPEARAANDRAFGFMANLEGYASHIEHDFLRKMYRLAEPLPHHTLVEAMLIAVTAPEDGADDARRAAQAKQDEYVVGRVAYQARAQGGNPATFDPDLRPARTAPGASGATR